MKIWRFSLGILLLAVLVELQTVMRRVPGGPAKVLKGLAAVALLASLVGVSIRAVRSLPVPRTEESERALYPVILVCLLLVWLALSLADLVAS